jgi:hypothetical protein
LKDGKEKSPALAWIRPFPGEGVLTLTLREEQSIVDHHENQILSYRKKAQL